MKTRTYADILARQGELAEALTIYRQLLAANPDEASLLARIRELEEEQDPEHNPLAPPTASGLALARQKRALEDLLHRVIARRRP